MNHEHANYSPEPAPRHRAEQPGDAYVADVIANAPTAETAQVIADAYARHGTAFALYLTLNGVEKYVPEYVPDDQLAEASKTPILEHDFKSVYYGRFEDREAIIDAIASFDWGTTLRRLLREHPDLEQIVVFDRDAIWGFASDHYEILDGTDGLYLFERWP